MAHWRLRHTYGHGAAKLTLAPAFTPSPYSRPDSLAANVKLALRDEHPARLVARVVLGSAGAVAGAFALALVLAPLFAKPPDDQETKIVMVTARPRVEEEELKPPPPAPEPVAEPEPEPEKVAEAPPPPPAKPEPPPEPVKVVKKAAPPPPLPAIPAPIEAPKEFMPTPAPLRVAREPVRKPPAVVSIDPLSPAPALPSTDPAPPPPIARTAARAPTASQRALPALADFTPIGDPAPAGVPAALPSRAVRTNVVARADSPSRPPAFAAAALAAPPAAYDEDSPEPALATRASATPKGVRPQLVSASRPRSLGFAAAATPAEVSDASAASVGRTERSAPKRAGSGGQGENLAAVPLGSLAACASDREEDERKMALLGAVHGRTECSSRAGRYRFVETKNLNAFLMWIERAPGRSAVDRCVELRLALECLGG